VLPTQMTPNFRPLLLAFVQHVCLPQIIPVSAGSPWVFQVPTKNLWELLGRDFFQAGCPSCQPTNSDSAQKDCTAHCTIEIADELWRELCQIQCFFSINENENQDKTTT